MGNSFYMQVDSSMSLNCLVYIQNIYINQHKTPERPLFPYLSQPVSFHDEFEERFRVLWKEFVKHIAAEWRSDFDISYKEGDEQWKRLFTPDPKGLNNLEEIRKGFKAWWESIAGRFSVENSPNVWVEKLYRDLSDTLKESGKVPQKPLRISLLYDRCVIAENAQYAYFAAIPIRSFFGTYNELVTEVKACLK